jgi:hypothetical protein
MSHDTHTNRCSHRCETCGGSMEGDGGALTECTRCYIIRLKAERVAKGLDPLTGKGDRKMKRLLAGLLVVGSLTFGSAAHAAYDSKWTWLEKTQGTSRIDSVKVWTKCLGAEDSAAHLKLLRYGNGTAVYGCYRKGY